MVGFYLEPAEFGGFYVCRCIYCLFGHEIVRMGYFTSENLQMAKDFKAYLDNNPEGELNDFFRKRIDYKA